MWDGTHWRKPQNETSEFEISASTPLPFRVLSTEATQFNSQLDRRPPHCARAIQPIPLSETLCWGAYRRLPATLASKKCLHTQFLRFWRVVSSCCPSCSFASSMYSNKRWQNPGWHFVLRVHAPGTMLVKCALKSLYIEERSKFCCSWPLTSDRFTCHDISTMKDPRLGRAPLSCF